MINRLQTEAELEDVGGFDLQPTNGAINVQEFLGVSGNGVVDVAALNQALLQGGSFYFPSGTYVFNDSLKIPSNVTITGDQGTIFQPSQDFPPAGILVKNAGFPAQDTNITISGITFDGANVARSADPANGMPLLAFSVKDSKFANSTVQNTPFMGLAFGGSQNVAIEGCTFTKCGNPEQSIEGGPALWVAGFQGRDSSNINVTGNKFTDNNWSAAYFMPNGGQFSDNTCLNNGESALFMNSNGKNITIANNVIDGTTRSNISGSGLELGGQNLKVYGNKISNCASDGISLTDVSNSEIRDNTIFNNGQESGEYEAFANASGIGVHTTSNVSNNVIQNNTIYDNQQTPTQQYAIGGWAENKSGFQNSTISGNNVYGNAKGAVLELTPIFGSSLAEQQKTQQITKPSTNTLAATQSDTAPKTYEQQSSAAISPSEVLPDFSQIVNPFTGEPFGSIDPALIEQSLAEQKTLQTLKDQLLAGWQGLGENVGIGSAGTPQAEIGGRPLNVVAEDFARRLLQQGITDLSQAKFDPGAQAAWTPEGHGNVSLVATPDGRLVPVWGSSSDASAARTVALSLALSFTGAGALIGSTVTSSLGIAASAATNAMIGNIVINTALNGGDIGAAVKGAVASWAGAQVGDMVGNAAKASFDSAEGVKLISNLANNATQAIVSGDNPESAIRNTLVAGAVDFATAKIPEFDKLPSSVQSTIKQSINAAVQGKDIDAGAMLANAAKEGLLSYGLSQIPQFNEADARTQSFVTTMLRSGIDGGDLSESAIKWAVGQAQQEFQKVIKAGPALDELKKAGIIKDASYFGLDDQQKELVDRLAAQKDPKAAAAQYINKQTTTPEEIRQFYKQITGKDATDAEAELLSTYTGPDEATARLGLENQIRANAAADELRFEELNKVFTNPQATDQDLINVMAEYKITPAFVEKITGQKYDDIVRQMDARFMRQDEVVEAYRAAREAAGLEPRDPTPDEILRYVGSNAGVTAQIQADMDREATTFDGSGAADIKEAMAAAKAAGYNNFTGPDGKTYMVSSPSVAIQAGAFDGTKLGSVEEARQAALREGKQTFVGPDEQTYRVTEKAAGGADRVFDASGYDPANEQQKALAAYSAYKLGYKNIAFADGTVFELSDKVGQSVANYDKQVAEARRLATQSEQSRQNAFDGSKFSDKGTAAIAANSAGKSSFTFSDGKVYQLPENFAQLVMPNQTAAETKRLNEQNQVLVSDAKGRAKTSFDSAWRAAVPFADPPAEGSTLRNLVSSLIFTGGAGVNMGVIGAINGVASIKLGAEPTVGYAGPDVEDARRYGVVISPYDSPEQREAKFRQLQELKDAGAKPLTVSNAPPIGRGNAWYDFAQQLKEIGAFNSPEAQASQRRISDFLKDVPAWEKPIALMAIANQGNWLGVTSYIAEELPEELPALITGNVIGSAYRLGLTGKAAISTLLDTAQDSGRAFQYGYEGSRSKGKDESQSKIDGAIAAGVTVATELLPDFLADRTLLKALHKEAAGIATNVLTNYAKNTGIALGTSFITEYISGGSNAAIMNKINYGDWKWDDAFTQATIEGFVGLGVAGTIMAGHDVSRAIGYMRDGTVATVKDLLDRNPNINYSTISRTEPLFNFSGNAISLDQLSQVTNVALADPTFEVSNFVETLNEMGRNGITPTNAVNLALTYTADPTSAAWKDVTPVGDVVAVNDNGTVTIQNRDGSQTIARADTALKVGDSVQVNPNTGTAVTSPAKVVSTDGNTATVQSRDGTTSTVTTTTPVNVSSQVNVNQATNTATSVDTSQTAAQDQTTATGATQAQTGGTSQSTVVATNTDGTKAIVENSDGTSAVVDTPGGAKAGDAVVVDPATNTAKVVDETANTGTVIATSSDGTAAVVQKTDGSTAVVNTDTTATVGDKVNINPVDNTATVQTGNVTDAVIADVNVTDGTATVITSDGTKAVVDTAGQQVDPGSIVTVDKDTATITTPETSGKYGDNTTAYYMNKQWTAAETEAMPWGQTVVNGQFVRLEQAPKYVQEQSQTTTQQPTTSQDQVVNPNTGIAADTNTGVVTNPNSGVSVDTNTGVATNANRSMSVDTNSGTAVNNQTNTAVETNTGVATNANTNTAVDTNTGVTTNPNTNTAVDTNTGAAVNANTGVAVDTNTGVATNTNTNTAVDTNTGTAVNPNTNTAVDTNTGTAVNTNTGVAVDTNTGVATNANTNTAVDTNTGVATNANTNTAVDTNTGVATNANTNTAVDTNTGVATNANTNTAVDTNTGVTVNPNTNTAVDTNTGVATTVNPNTNTQTNVDTSTGTATTVDPNTGVQTQVDPNTNTQTTVDPKTNTQTTTDTSTGTQVKTNIEEPKVVEDPRIKQLQDRIDQLIQAGLDQTAATNAAMSELTGQLSTLTQAQNAAEQARQQAAQQAAQQQSIRGALELFAPQTAVKGANEFLPVSPLQTSGSSKFISPLAAFLATVESQNYAQPKPQQQPMTPQQPQVPDRYAYGKEPSIDELLDPYGERRKEPAMGFKAGGLASPLFAVGGGTRYGKYAKGGLNVVHHSGKARVDFRHGDAVTGPGDGQSDDIPAMLADGEFVFPADVVAALGNGSTKAGSDKLYDMMHSIRAHARSSGPKDLPPPAKSPLEYLKGAKQKSARRTT